MNKQYVLFFTLLSIATSRLLLSQDSEASSFDDAVASTEDFSKDITVDQDESMASDESAKDESVKQAAQATDVDSSVKSVNLASPGIITASFKILKLSDITETGVLNS